MNFNSITGAVQVLIGWYNKAVKVGQVVGDNSLSDLTKDMKVEPLVIVSKDCIGVEAMPDIMQGLLNYTIADYIQAVSIWGRVDDIKVRRTLERFNPARDGSAGALLATVNLESRTEAASKFMLPIGDVPTMEDNSGIPQQKGGKLNTKELQEEAKNMSVGKLVDVPFTASVGNEKAEQVVLPIQFRLLASFVNSSSMVNMLSNGQDDTGFWSRFERARDGSIFRFTDFIMAQDMIEEKRKVLFSEDGRVLQKIMSRAAANKRAALASRNPSLASLANIFVITEEEAKSLEAALGRPLDNEGAREQVFRNVYASCLVIVDRQWNNVTFWHRGRDSATTYDFKQLKAQSNGKGPDLMDMFRQFNLGMPLN